MKSASAGLISHLALNATTLATCWKVERRDGTLLGFTDHDQDIVFDAGDGDGSLTYKAATGYTRTAIANTADLSVDNLEVESFLDSAAISDADLRAGRYDFAEVRIFVVNWADLAQGAIWLRRGTLGEVTTRDEIYTAELMGLTQRLSQVVGRTYTPECAVDLGSPGCGIELKPAQWQANTAYAIGQRVSPTSFNARKFKATQAGTSGASEPTWNLTVGGSTSDGTVVWGTEEAWTLQDEVESVTDDAVFAAVGIPEVAGKADGWFDEGLVRWLTGLNAGTAMEVKTWVQLTKTFTLFLPMPFAIEVGDTFEVTPGCDKRLSVCKAKFSNVVNFQGFPHVPGNDQFLRFPDART